MLAFAKCWCAVRVHIPCCYCCQLDRVNNLTSAAWSIVSPKTITQLQGMTGKRHSFFSGVWRMLFHGILKTKPESGAGGPEKTTCLYPPLTTAETGPTVSSFKLSSNQEPFWEKAFVLLVWRHPMKSFHFVWLIWQWGCHNGNFDWYREQNIARSCCTYQVLYTVLVGRSRCQRV